MFCDSPFKINNLIPVRIITFNLSDENKEVFGSRSISIGYGNSGCITRSFTNLKIHLTLTIFKYSNYYPQEIVNNLVWNKELGFFLSLRIKQIAIYYLVLNLVFWLKNLATVMVIIVTYCDNQYLFHIWMVDSILFALE